MKLTTNPVQLQTLRDHLDANQNAVSVGGGPLTAINALPRNSDTAVAVAAWYNLPASPDFRVYRPSVPMSEIMLNGFDWTRVDNLSVGKARIWEWMVEANPQSRTIDPSKTNIRAGINAAWVGTAADLAVRAAVYAHCHRSASRAERLFILSGLGTAPDAAGDGPGLLSPTATGDLAPPEVEAAWNLPS